MWKFQCLLLKNLYDCSFYLFPDFNFFDDVDDQNDLANVSIQSN